MMMMEEDTFDIDWAEFQKIDHTVGVGSMLNMDLMELSKQLDFPNFPEIDVGPSLAGPISPCSPLFTDTKESQTEPVKRKVKSRLVGKRSSESKPGLRKLRRNSALHRIGPLTKLTPASVACWPWPKKRRHWGELAESTTDEILAEMFTVSKQEFIVLDDAFGPYFRVFRPKKYRKIWALELSGETERKSLTEESFAFEWVEMGRFRLLPLKRDRANYGGAVLPGYGPTPPLEKLSPELLEELLTDCHRLMRFRRNQARRLLRRLLQCLSIFDAFYQEVLIRRLSPYWNAFHSEAFRLT